MTRTLRRAFTLIELLTVMAISAILLSLIIIPLFQSFNLTRTAQAFSDAQENARVVTDRIAREIGGAVSVRNTGGLVNTTLNGAARQVPQHATVIRLPGLDGGPRELVIPYAKLDLVLAAEGDPTRVNGAYVNPITGAADPTLQAPRGQVNLPVGPGQTMVRYFVALRDPFTPYTNPYLDLRKNNTNAYWIAPNAARDNLYLLYRAEIQPMIYRPRRGSDDPSTIALRPNLQFFESDAATDTQIIGLDDPRFMIPEFDGAGNAITTGDQAQRIQNWRRRSVVQTEVSRYDMIQPVYNRANRQMTFEANGDPRVLSLVQFRPSRVNSDPVEGQVAVRPGEESDFGAAIAPDVFVGQYPLWSNAIIRTFPQGWTRRSATANEYLVGRGDPTTQRYGIFAYDPNAAPDDTQAGTPLFDVTAYERIIATGGLYPFTGAILAVDTSWLNNERMRQIFTPYTYNSGKGTITASFSISEVGRTFVAPDNLPSVLTNPAGEPAYSPDQDPDVTGNFYEAKFSTVNRRFNKVWRDNPQMQPDNVHRFIDLRVVRNRDNTPSPLYPNPLAGEATGFQLPTDAPNGNRSKVNIVPGSEVVTGPDQTAAPDGAGNVPYVRYTRVTGREPGPNQYTINYTDLPEPRGSSAPGSSVDYSVLGYLTPAQLAGFNPQVYDPQNFVSAVVQPRYKVGYLRFNSDANIPMPTGEIKVSYRFQFTGNQTGPRNALSGNVTDRFSVDYDTRQLMAVLLTIRNYPQANVPNPQSVTLKATAAVRNYSR